MAPEVEADVRPQPVLHVTGDAFVLCSDGLSDLVEDQEILEIVGERPAAQAVGQLVDLANARGGHDNITVVVLRARRPRSSASTSRWRPPWRRPAYRRRVPGDRAGAACNARRCAARPADRGPAARPARSSRPSRPPARTRRVSPADRLGHRARHRRRGVARGRPRSSLRRPVGQAQLVQRARAGVRRGRGRGGARADPPSSRRASSFRPPRAPRRAISSRRSSPSTRPPIPVMYAAGLTRRATRESSRMTRMRRAVPLALIAIALAATPGCKRSKHARVTPFVAPALPAGFVEQSGVGWRVAVPSTWKERAEGLGRLGGRRSASRRRLPRQRQRPDRAVRRRLVRLREGQRGGPAERAARHGRGLARGRRRRRSHADPRVALVAGAPVDGRVPHDADGPRVARHRVRA